MLILRILCAKSFESTLRFASYLLRCTKSVDPAQSTSVLKTGASTDTFYSQALRKLLFGWETKVLTEA